MSSTGRGSIRMADDHYETPAWCVQRILEALPPEFPKGGTWLEPCAGAGAIIRAVNQQGLATKWIGCDLTRDPPDLGLGEKLDWRKGDFLSLPWKANEAEVIFTNPPYKLAEEFLHRSLLIAPWVVFLLRLNFLSSEKRSDFMQSCAPDVNVLPNRPSFTSDGGTDSIEYAWFLWGPDRKRETGRIRVLKTTPKTERGRGRVSKQEPKVLSLESSA